MLVRDYLDARLERPAPDGPAADLPRRLKPDQGLARTALLKRLAASRHFAFGDRRGVLSAATRRSGRAFRLDVRQRVIVKALVSRHVGARPGGALAKHVAYLGRSGAGAEGDHPSFFDRTRDGLEPGRAVADWAGDRHHFRLIISPEHGERIADLPDYVRDVMGRVSGDLGEPALAWIATCHFDTDQPHAHVLVRGRRADGRDLVIPRDYVAYGIRARAQEVAQERLGDLSRIDAERRVWRLTEADQFTAMDRRLLEAADPDGYVEGRFGDASPWGALTRGRLAHLERLGLAERHGRDYRLAPDLAARLRSLQIGRDIIRTLNQRRLDGAREVRTLDAGRVRGMVVKSGAHDELGAATFAVVRDENGVEHYARLRAGHEPLQVGVDVVVKAGSRGASVDAQAGLARGG